MEENSPEVLCSRNIKIVGDKSLTEVQDQIFDAVILPGGGKGAQSLCNSTLVGEILKKHQSCEKILAAVCAAPTAFLSHGIGKGQKITSYPAFKEKLDKDFNYSVDRVVVDGNIVTSRGPGTYDNKNILIYIQIMLEFLRFILFLRNLFRICLQIGWNISINRDGWAVEITDFGIIDIVQQFILKSPSWIKYLKSSTYNYVYCIVLRECTIADSTI